MIFLIGTYSTFGVFFKPVLNEFGWTRAMTSGAFSLSWLMQGLLAILMGRLTDRFGPRMVIALCGLLTGLGFMLMAKLGAVWEFYLFFGIIGTGLSGANVSLMSTVARWFVKRRGVMTGFVMAGGGIGSFIGPPFAERLISAYDWRSSYIILGILVLIYVILAAQLLKRDPEEIGQLPRGMDKDGNRQAASRTGSFSFRQAVSTIQFWKIFIMFFCLGFCAYAIIVHIAPHATDQGIPAHTAARILATIGGLVILGRIIMGAVGDRIGNKRAFIIGYVLGMAAFLWLVPADQAWMLYLAAGLFGFSWGIGALGSPLVAGTFGLSSHGLNLGVINFGYSVGAAVGPFITGYIFDVGHSYRFAFMVCAALAFFGLISTLLLKQKISKPMEDM